MKDHAIVVLTYDAPHRKTEDVIWKLLSGGISKFSIIGTPWVERKPRKYIYGHRPAEPPWPNEPNGHPSSIYKNVGIGYEVVQPASLCARLRRLEPELVVVGGAGILDPQIVSEFKVLNVHPGLLPWRRGLDILKWTIIDLGQVGVTAHLCDENADLGWRILESIVPVYPQDSFQSFAARQYEMELGLLRQAVPLALVADRSKMDRIEAFGTDSKRRMPREIEAGLPEAFERYKRIYAWT
jgi:phosphoribosylglycinamide formyltransferase-1